MVDIHATVRKCGNYTLYGRLSKSATEKAANTLSPSAFRLWVLMAMNVDGWQYQLGSLVDSKSVEELRRFRYLSWTHEGHLIFRDDPTVAPPYEEAWDGVCSLYEGDTFDKNLALEYVLSKLDDCNLTDKAESILWYIFSYHNDLQQLRGQSKKPVQDVFRYDFAVGLTWFLWDHFELEVGDSFSIDKVRTNDPVVQKALDAIKYGGENIVLIGEANRQQWQKWYSGRKLKIPASEIGNILRDRDVLGIAA